MRTVQSILEKHPDEKDKIPLGYARQELILDTEGNPIDWKYLEVNQAFENHTGIPVEGLVGKLNSEVMTEPELYKDWLDIFYKSAYNNQDQQIVSWSQPLQKWFEVSIYSSENGHFTTLFRDVTKYEEEKRMYADVLSSISDAVFITDTEGNFKFVCPNVSFIFGFNSEEVEELKNIEYLIGSDYKRKLVNQDHAGKLVENLEQAIVDKSGKIHHLLIDIKSTELFGGGYLFTCRDISERVRETETAKLERNKLKAIINTIPDLVWIKDPEGTYILCNHEFEVFYGATEAEIIGKKDTDFVSKELADFFRKHDLKAMNANKPLKNEETLPYLDGSKTIEAETTKTPFYSAEGELLGVLGVARDITERKESETRLREFVNGTSDAIYSINEKGVIENVNEAASQQTGYKRAELIGQPIWHLSNSISDYEDFSRRFVDLETNKSYFFDSEHTRKDGTIIPVEIGLRVFAIKGINHFYATVRDISKRKSDEKRFGEVIRQAPYGIALVSDDGIPFLVNEALCDMLGYSADELTKMHFKEFTHPDDFEVDLQQYTDLVQGQVDSFSIEKRYLAKNGETVPASLKITAINAPFEEKGKVNLAMVENLTDKKKNEKQLEKYHRFFKIAQDNFCIANQEGEFLELNPQFPKTLGYSYEELKKQIFLDLVHPDDLQSTLDEMKKLNSGEKTIKFRNRYRTKSGDYRYFDWSSTPHDGLYYGVARDVTEEVKVKIDLQDKKDLLDKAQHTAKLGYWTLDISNDILYWSDEIFRIFGEEPQSFKGNVDAFYDFIHPEEREHVRAYFNECVEKQLPYQIVHRIITKEGEIKYVEEKAEITYDSNEKLISALGTVQDITQRHLVETELKLRDQNLEKFFENVNVGIAKNAMDGSFIEINPEFERFTGYTVEELNNMSYWDLTPDKYQEQEEIQLKSLEEKGRYGPYQKEYRIKKGDLIPVLLNGVKIVDANGNEFIWSVVQDISENENDKKRLVQDVEKFKLLLETGKLIAFEVDLKTQEVTTIRDRIKIDSTAFPIEEIRNLADFFKAIKKEQRGSCQYKLDELLKGKIERFSCDFQIKQGTRFFWHQGTLTVLGVDASGDPNKVFITLRNIEEEKNDEKRRLISQEKERLRISRDIHDSIGQLLVGTRLTLKTKKNDLSNLEDIDEMLDLMIKESRLIINNFGISLQDSKNLRDAFDRLQQRMKRVYSGDISLNWTGRKSVDDLKTATHIFRIYQEALSNAIKYSNSPKIDINIQNQNIFKMEVTDLGVGFDFQKISEGFGMENMKERAREMGAKITLKSSLGEGTTVFLTFDD
ncbi:MAG: PAS domain S-box protein [Ekhidna sp.]